MNILEIIKIAFSSLKESKLRTALTMLAIVVGVFAIIGSLTAVKVLDSYFNNTLNVMGGNVISISKYPGVRVGNGDEYRNRQDISFEQFENLQEKARIARTINPFETFRWVELAYGDEKTDPNIRVRGSNMFFLNNNAYTIEDGRNFTDQDIQYSRAVVIIGADIKDELFETVNPIGKSIKISGKNFQIIGTLESKGSTFGQSQDNFILIPYTAAIAMYGAVDRDITIQVAAPNITLVPETMDEIIGLMRTIRKVPPGEPNDFEVSTNNSLKGVFEQFTGFLYLFGFVVGGVSLLGAGIGVMNIMLVSVTERTREIGIRKAIGATRSAITRQFLVEAIFICQLGGFFGLILGIIGGNVLAVVMESNVVFPIDAAVIGIVGMTIIGLVFGVFPAVKAAKLDPIESLRYE